jgi:pSer/pThr/pTyr-binding forkhead associated (FHA) protein
MSILLLVIRVFLVIALYLFIGWVVYTLWIEIYRRPARQTETAVPLLTLNYQDAAGPHSFRITQHSAGIGSAAGNDVLLIDTAVADRHAVLTYHQSQWWLENIDPDHPLLLNAERVIDPVVLINGDTISIGPYQLDVSLEEK